MNTYPPGMLSQLTSAISSILGNDADTAEMMAGVILALNETMLAESQRQPVPAGGFQLHYHDATGQEDIPCLCAQPGTYARQASNPLDSIRDRAIEQET